jgi:hypothetical protein
MIGSSFSSGTKSATRPAQLIGMIGRHIPVDFRDPDVFVLPTLYGKSSAV